MPNSRLNEDIKRPLCRNVPTTPIVAKGCQHCLPLSVVQLHGKHCRKPHCHNGIVDMFSLGRFSQLFLRKILLDNFLDIFDDFLGIIFDSSSINFSGCFGYFSKLLQFSEFLIRSSINLVFLEHYFFYIKI